MIRPSALRSVAVAAIAAAALLSACGSSDDSSDATSAPAATAGGAATTAAADSGGLYGGGDTETTAAAAPAAGGAEAVTIADFAFDPSDLEVTKGTTVTWTNTDGTAHRIKADDESFTSDNLAEDATFEHTFDTAGTFAYICAIHPSMKGTITVS